MKGLVPNDVSRKEAAIVIIFLAFIFFFIAHNLNYSREKESIRKTINVEENILEGSLTKRIALLSFGMISLVVLLFAKKRNHLTWGEPLGWVLILFGAWSLGSVIWSIDTALTFRRLAVFGTICLGAFVMASRYSASFIPLCVFCITTSYLATGLSLEIVSLKFQPLSSDYRFSGTVHANIQGINCAMMLLACISLAEYPNKKRYFFLIAALLAFAGLILTKSRTSLICVLFTLSILLILNVSILRAFGYLLGVFGVLAMFYLFMGDDLMEILTKYLFLGRSYGEVTSLTGRTSVWKTILSYINERPFLGYGFSSFWIPLHIQDVSYVEGWTISDAHSAYIDLFLGIGIVGLIIYLSILFLGMRKAITMYIQNRDGGYQFFSLILIFFAIHGFTESSIIQFSSFESFFLTWGLFYMAFFDRSQKESG